MQGSSSVLDHQDLQGQDARGNEDESRIAGQIGEGIQLTPTLFPGVEEVGDVEDEEDVEQSQVLLSFLLPGKELVV